MAIIPEEHRFKHEHLLAAAESLISYDEVELATKVLSCIPALHRDHRIPAVEELKARIRAASITAHAYMSSTLDQDVSIEQAVVNIQNLLRGRILLKEIQALHRKGLKAHIVDMGPGEYWVPIGLSKLGYEHSYWPLAMDQVAKAKAEKHIEAFISNKVTHPTIFVAHEIIEHLPSTDDITIEALRHCDGWPDYVHLSTPLYTFDCRPKQWDKPCGLPHLRAYTPDEFQLEAQRLFPGYKWEHRTDHVQSLRGYRAGEPLLGEISK